MEILQKPQLCLVSLDPCEVGFRCQQFKFYQMIVFNRRARFGQFTMLNMLRFACLMRQLQSGALFTLYMPYTVYSVHAVYTQCFVYSVHYVFYILLCVLCIFCALHSIMYMHILYTVHDVFCTVCTL